MKIGDKVTITHNRYFDKFEHEKEVTSGKVKDIYRAKGDEVWAVKVGEEYILANDIISIGVG